MRTLAIFLLTTGLAFAQTTVYKCKAPDGSVIFSDQTCPDAEKIEVKAAQTVASPGGVKGLSERKGGVPAQTPYTKFAIVSPTDDQAVRSNGGEVSVSISVNPGLRAKHAIVVTVDGQPIGKGSSTTLTLQNLPRGTHTVQAAVVDEKGKEIVRSETVTFHVLRV